MFPAPPHSKVWAYLTAVKQKAFLLFSEEHKAATVTFSCFYFCHIPAWSMGSSRGRHVAGEKAEVLRALAAISQLTQKDSKN